MALPNSTIQISKNIRMSDRILNGSLIEGSLEVKLPTIWRDEKQSREEA